MRGQPRRWALGGCIAATLAPASAQAQSAPDAGRAFERQPAPEELRPALRALHAEIENANPSCATSPC